MENVDKRLSQALENCVPVKGTPGELYLRSRGIQGSPNVLFSPNFYQGCELLSCEGKFSRGVGPSVVGLAHDREGGVVAAQARVINPRPPSEARPKPMRMLTVGTVGRGVFSTPGAFDWDVALVCEGIFNALSYAAVGMPAIATLGAANLPEYLSYALGGKGVVSGYDDDAAGEVAHRRLLRLLQPWSIHVVRVNPDPFRELGEDANELFMRSPELLREVACEARAKVTDPLLSAFRREFRAVIGKEPPINLYYCRSREGVEEAYGLSGVKMLDRALHRLERRRGR